MGELVGGVKIALARARREILAGSKIAPNGNANKIVRTCGDVRYHIVAMDGYFSEEAVRLIAEEAQGRTFSTILIEGPGDVRPEVEMANFFHTIESIPTVDVIVPPESEVVSEAAGIRLYDALFGIMGVEQERYLERPEVLIEHLAKMMNLQADVVASVHRSIRNWGAMIDCEERRTEEAHIMASLYAAARDISWHALQMEQLSGDVLVVARDLFVDIFGSNYRPQRSYPAEEIRRIRESHAMHLFGTICPRSKKESSELIMPEKYPGETEIRELVGQWTTGFYGNDLLRKRIEKMIVAAFQVEMRKGECESRPNLAYAHFIYAEKLAMELQGVSLEKGNALRRDASLALYEVNMERKVYFSAVNNARTVLAMGIEEGRPLLVSALTAGFNHCMEKGYQSEAESYARQLADLGMMERI